MIFSDDGVQSIRSWYPVLGWEKLPNFGHFHTNRGIESFKKNYYVSSELKTFYLNLIETMKNGYDSVNIRITGDPGAGKTSFLYSLIEQSKISGSGFENFVFHIFHINKADHETYEKEIQHNIKEAWKKYYYESGMGDHYIKVRQQNLPLKDTINRLSDIFKENKSNFNKILFFIIDDVDLLDGVDVAKIADCVIQNIEVASVKKWLVLRDVSYENYTGKTKDKIEQFFPDPFKFPTISLYELISHRIKNTSCESIESGTKAKIPFSKEICDEVILTMCDGSLRQGLSLLKTILEESLPKRLTTSNDEKFIINFLDKASINTLLSSNKLINLHSNNFRTSVLPLAIDILMSSCFHNSYNIIYGSTNDATVKRDNLSGKIASSQDRFIKMREEDFKHSLKSLVDHGLIKLDGKDKILITEKGKIHSKYITSNHYFEYCKTKQYSTSGDKTYWELAKYHLDYKQIVTTLLTWQDFQR